jgi:hypothetical protein
MKAFLAAAALISLMNAAYAQNREPVPQQTPDKDCIPADSRPHEQSGQPLSDKLSESKGVLCPPPSMDSEMKMKPPDTGGNMPVIKPPSSAK